MGTGGSFSGDKAAGVMTMTTYLHLVLRSKNAWSYTSTPQYVFMEWFMAKQRGNFNFSLP